METYTALAQQALHSGRPRYKLRPKFHQFHCELVLRMLTSRLNPRWGSCWTEEDYVGQITKVVKGAVHSLTISRRVLQRWQLHYNAKLACARERFAVSSGFQTPLNHKPKPKSLKTVAILLFLCINIYIYIYIMKNIRKMRF